MPQFLCVPIVIVDERLGGSVTPCHHVKCLDVSLSQAQCEAVKTKSILSSSILETTSQEDPFSKWLQNTSMQSKSNPMYIKFFKNLIKLSNYCLSDNDFRSFQIMSTIVLHYC